MTLEAFFAQHPRAALGFSGGVDSAYLLYAARLHGCQVGAYFIKTPFQPQFELEDAHRLAAGLGVRLQVLEFDVLALDEVAKNGPRRCYYCKRALFGRLAQQARQDGYPVLLDGTNASDDAADRPGMQALREPVSYTHLGLPHHHGQCALSYRIGKGAPRRLFIMDAAHDEHGAAALRPDGPGRRPEGAPAGHEIGLHLLLPYFHRAAGNGNPPHMARRVYQIVQRAEALQRPGRVPIVHRVHRVARCV